MLLCSVDILAVDNSGLLRMQFQPILRKAASYAQQYIPGLFLCVAVHNYVIGVAFKRQHREMLSHPLVKRLVQKQVCQQWTNYSPLRGALGIAIQVLTFLTKARTELMPSLRRMPHDRYAHLRHAFPGCPSNLRF